MTKCFKINERKVDEIMQLTEYEQKMLSGEYGKSKRKAMEILVTMGDSFRAKNMVEIKMFIW
jgi:predicted aconitase